MTDLQAEINAKEKCQEQLNIIYKNAQILGEKDVTTKYTKEYLAQLESDNEKAWEKVVEIATPMTK